MQEDGEDDDNDNSDKKSAALCWRQQVVVITRDKDEVEDDFEAIRAGLYCGSQLLDL